ncbi:MAG: hypothetical protein ACLVKO_04275 [Dysgonomonas sp.]
MDAKKQIKDLFKQAVNILSHDYKGSSLTDIFVLVDEESGELSIYDDEQNCIAKAIVEDWQIASDKEAVNYAAVLRTVVEEMDDADLFQSLDVYTPFSINYADEDFIVIEELLLIEDDSIIRMEDDFLKRIDREFDEFLDKLLKE